MTLPSSVEALLALASLGLPVAVWASVRRYLVGERAADRDWSTALVQGVTFSSVLLGFYALLGVLPWLSIGVNQKSGALEILDLPMFAMTSLALFVVVPLLASFVLLAKHCTWKQVSARGFTWVRYPGSRYGYSGTPTSWDFAVKKHSSAGAWVKVRKATGVWVGGWFATGSHASMYPEPPALFLHSQWAMDAEGNFIEDIPNTGIWIPINDGDLVIWISRDPSAKEGNGR
jgi:hypothetical protein